MRNDPKLIEIVTEKIIRKLDSVARRTSGSTPDELRHKLAIAELNWDEALTERDYLLSAEWKPVVEELAAELREARRLLAKMPGDLIVRRRVDEILLTAIAQLDRKTAEKEAAAA